MLGIPPGPPLGLTHRSISAPDPPLRVAERGNEASVSRANRGTLPIAADVRSSGGRRARGRLLSAFPLVLAQPPHDEEYEADGERGLHHEPEERQHEGREDLPADHAEEADRGELEEALGHGWGSGVGVAIRTRRRGGRCHPSDDGRHDGPAGLSGSRGSGPRTILGCYTHDSPADGPTAGAAGTTVVWSSTTRRRLPFEPTRAFRMS